MSFTKLRAGGFGANTTLSSAELSTLDTDHANALDKTGDTVGSTATITWPSGSTCSFASGSTFTCATGSTLTVAGSTTFQNDVLVNTNSRIFCGGVILQSQAGVDSTINNVNIKTITGGRFVLGDNDYPKLGSTHAGITQKVLIPFGNLTPLASGWLQTDGTLGTGVTGPGNTTPARIILPQLWNGALISNVDILFNVYTGHASIPTNFPAAMLQYKVPTVGASAPVWQTTGASVTYASEVLATWNNGQTKRLTMSIGTPTVARDTTLYAIQLTDENGGGAASASVLYQCAIVTYTIADLRPA